MSKTIVPTGYYFQKESTLKKAEIEIVTNIINGQWRASYANYEHEKIGEKQVHLDPERVEEVSLRSGSGWNTKAWVTSPAK
ncbi:MAG TPA: hypothetical protein VK775_11880 [Chthoniobacterales bacterium]|nr:hypothetical protein [Chthoniobacterales bacterium]